MFKIIIKNIKAHQLCSRILLLRKFIVLDLISLENITNDKLYAEVMDQARMPNGTCKTTKQNRFNDLDQALTHILLNNKSFGKYLIHDMAVSDGITTVDLFKILEDNKLLFELHSSDKYFQIFYRKQNGITVFQDVEGSIIRINVLGIIADKYLSWKFFISKILGRILYKKLEGISLIKKNELLLLSPEFKQHLQKNIIKFEGNDIFNKPNKLNFYDVIRCMNILNPLYFSQNEIKNALDNIFLSLKDNGLFLIGRTDPISGLNSASIYKKEKESFHLIKSFNGGTEILNLIESQSLIRKK